MALPALEDLERLRGAAKGRNVVLIVLESTAARYLGLYGAASDPTPTLTDLGRRAVVFESAYAVYPESVKGLFSTLCSRYPAFDVPVEVHARAPCASLAESLAETGYRTSIFHSGRFGYLGMAPMIDGRGFDVREDAGAIGGHVRSSFGVDEPSTVRRMLEWVDSLDGRERFFLMYLPVAGHHPYATPDYPGPFEGAGDFDRYLNSLQYGDAALRVFIDGLRARHLDDRTLFVIQGDHGEAFGQHADNVAHSLFIYDENVRIPYLIAAPGLITGPVRIKRVASAVDTTPTILDLLGQEAAAEHQGISLLKPEPRPAYFYTDYSLGWLGLRDSCWKYLYEIMPAGRSCSTCAAIPAKRGIARRFPITSPDVSRARRALGYDSEGSRAARALTHDHKSRSFPATSNAGGCSDASGLGRSPSSGHVIRSSLAITAFVRNRLRAP